ncbi:LOW QUALITY PROTEIN: hypothetical protein CVT25_002094 [Psilocybe cyanescens]|uniref:Uncharacterized protein n=1 Tax=Psilocybe cyanescens TaxID=93625 RepID=A0A409X9G7_PSICY|nr:LOW QUALITY PROTEIN: hypothetical protein CVT25_002094 [Psilocybe cyanescens]
MSSDAIIKYGKLSTIMLFPRGLIGRSSFPSESWMHYVKFYSSQSDQTSGSLLLGMIPTTIEYFIHKDEELSSDVGCGTLSTTANTCFRVFRIDSVSTPPSLPVSSASSPSYGLGSVTLAGTRNITIFLEGSGW